MSNGRLAAHLSMILLAIALVAAAGHTAHAQATDGAPTPDSAVERIRQDAAQMQLELQKLRADLDTQRQTTDILRQQMSMSDDALRQEILKASPLWQPLLVLLAGLAALGFSLKELKQRLEKHVEQRLAATLNERIERLDPARVAVRYDSRLSLSRYADRIRDLGFADVQPYAELGPECRRGCIVVDCSDPDSRDETIAALGRFMRSAPPLSPSRVAFLIYLPSAQGPFRPETLASMQDAFPWFTFANSPMTLITGVLTVARTLAAGQG